MRTRRLETIVGKQGTPHECDEIKAAARVEPERMRIGKLRKARSLTQVELAHRLSISQASVAELEGRTDLHVSTLSKYIRAMGGHLELRAVFADGAIELELPPGARGSTKPASNA